MLEENLKKLIQEAIEEKFGDLETRLKSLEKKLDAIDEKISLRLLRVGEVAKLFGDKETRTTKRKLAKEGIEPILINNVSHYKMKDIYEFIENKNSWVLNRISVKK